MPEKSLSICRSQRVMREHMSWERYGPFQPGYVRRNAVRERLQFGTRPLLSMMIRKV